MPIPPTKSPGHGLPSVQSFHRIESHDFDPGQFAAFCRALRKSPRLINLFGEHNEVPLKWIDLALIRDDALEAHASVALVTHHYPEAGGSNDD